MIKFFKLLKTGPFSKSVRLVIILCLCLDCLALTSCEDTAETYSGDIDYSDGKWIDSDITGSIGEDDEIALCDDFAAAVNKDWKLEQDRPFTLLQDVEELMIQKCKAVLSDESVTGETAEALKSYYSLSSDWEGRNEDGMEPLRKYIDDIEAIADTEGLYQWMSDPERNPLFAGPLTVPDYGIDCSDKFPESYTVYITRPGLSLEDDLGDAGAYFDLSTDRLELFEQTKDKAAYLLEKLGYSGQDVKKITGNFFAMEKKLCATDDHNANKPEEDMTYTRAELIEAAGDFPTDTLLNRRGYENNDIFTVNMKLVKKAASLCRGGNLQKMKDYLIVYYALFSGLYLDTETYDMISELDAPKMYDYVDMGKTAEEEEDSLQFDTYINGSPMVGAMGRLYYESCFDKRLADELYDTTEKLKNIYCRVFENEEWLSEEGKAACAEKLDAMNIHIAQADFDSVDYGDMDIIPREKGGSFLEAYFEARRFMEKHKAELSNKPYDRNYWDPLDTGLATTQVNALYSPDTNGIYILAGFCDGRSYSYDMTYEEKLANMFATVGHEITHGFDREGATYDKDGLNNDLLPEDDMKAFNDRADLVSFYFSDLTPFEGAGSYDGEMVSSEATADMGGLTGVLILASEDKDFDYDLFFKSYAEFWRCDVTLDMEIDSMKNDPHPLAFYRINSCLQQCDEFLETYNIKEGDGMYLDPAKRIAVW